MLGIKQALKKKLLNFLNVSPDHPDFKHYQNLIETLQEDNKKTKNAIISLNRSIFETNAKQKVDNYIDDFVRRNNISKNLITKISPHDNMFYYSLYVIMDYPIAVMDYLNNGLHQYSVIQKLAEEAFGGLQQVNSLLDFASGYGRMTRFLTLDMDPGKIWISDIKKSGVEFQKKHFGVNGFISDVTPDTLEVDKKFDFIFVASLFSHLPEDLFLKWLKKLTELLTDDGKLAFSVHDTSLVDGYSDKQFQYLPQNEDELFPNSEDNLNDKSTYGLTFVNEDFVCKNIEQTGLSKKNYVRYQKALAKMQDIYVVGKSPVKMGKIDFSRYPR